MYSIIFTQQAATQYADIVEILSPYKKKLSVFEKEIEQVIRRLEQMPYSYNSKNSAKAARLVKSAYYLFYHIEEEAKRVVISLIISQKADPKNWPQS